MALDLTDVVPIYQENIDALIDQMGKTVTLYMKQTTTGVADSNYDPVRNAVKLPAFKTGATGPTLTDNTTSFKALIKWDPKEFKNFSINVNKPQSTLRLKTYITNAHHLARCEYLIPDVSTSTYILGKFKLAGPIAPIGLQENRYCVSFWEQIGGS